MLHSSSLRPYLQHKFRLERLAKDKHSILLRTLVNYRCSKVLSKLGLSHDFGSSKNFSTIFLFTIAQRTRHISQHTFLPGEVEKARHISQHTTPVFVIVILKMLLTKMLLTKCYLQNAPCKMLLTKYYFLQNASYQTLRPKCCISK